MDTHLTESQAAAIYAAMAQLNNVGGKIHATVMDDDGFLVHVHEAESGGIVVYLAPDMWDLPINPSEWYANQHEFREAYGIPD